ncbi:hypothetical protein ADK59_04870 [Streptomyces sp. XY332]|nr:hypothetical protein ADK59_04870 [Streptomyces sp. XY332]
MVMMTARSTSSQWLSRLRKVGERDGHLCRERRLELPSEHPEGAAVFRGAVEAFHRDPDPIDREAAEGARAVVWTTLDYVLLAMLAARSPHRRPTDRDDLYEEVLSHESDYWAQTYRESTDTGAAPRAVLDRAVVCLTLRAPTTRAETLAALRAVEELADAPRWRESICTTLTTCLQSGPGEAVVLRPDPVADYLILHTLRDDPYLLGGILDGLDSDQLLTALRQLNRAASADPDSATATATASDWVSKGSNRWQAVLQVAAEQDGAALAALDHLIDVFPHRPGSKIYRMPSLSRPSVCLD